MSGPLPALPGRHIIDLLAAAFTPFIIIPVDASLRTATGFGGPAFPSLLPVDLLLGGIFFRAGFGGGCGVASPSVLPPDLPLWCTCFLAPEPPSFRVLVDDLPCRFELLGSPSGLLLRLLGLSPICLLGPESPAERDLCMLWCDPPRAGDELFNLSTVLWSVLEALRLNPPSLDLADCRAVPSSVLLRLRPAL